MSRPIRIGTIRRTFLTLLLAVTLAMPQATLELVAATPEPTKPAACVINFIGHETTSEKTRVILHATTPIDYRGGMLQGDQVILNLANVTTSLPTPVVELGTPEVARVVIGPEVSRDGERLLKIRLTGVRASTHKVEAKHNELLVDLIPMKGSRDEEPGMPKLIDNNTPVMARATAPAVTESATWAKGEPAPRVMNETLIAVAAGEMAMAPLEKARPEKAPVTMEQAEPEGTDSRTPSPSAAVPVEPRPTMPPASPMPAPRSTLLSMPVAADETSARVLKVGTGRSLTLETGQPITRVSISNPAVAEPVAISPTQLLINGLKPGVVSLVLWPRDGAPIVYELVVHLDTVRLSQQIEEIFPGESIRVQSSKDSIVLSGRASDPRIAETITKLAGDYSDRVIDRMNSPEGRRQVMLKVKFAEVNKSAMTELGAVLHHVDPTNPTGSDRGNSGTGSFSPPIGNLLNDPIGPDLNWSDAINLSFFEKTLDLGLFITALKSRGLFQELAEPTLITADGQEASFLAGGEFPVPVAQPGANFTSVTIEWKKFGISLYFKPDIRDDGTIVMKVKPEVSALDFSNAILLQGFRIPAVTVRRAETEVELSSGQAFAIAGLYDRNLLQTKSKIPILGDIPLLGYLFRSKNLQKNRTELVVIVTPTIVEPQGREADIATPEMPESFDLEKKKSGK